MQALLKVGILNLDTVINLFQNIIKDQDELILAQAAKMDDIELEETLKSKLQISATHENMENYKFWATPSELTTGTRSR